MNTVSKAMLAGLMVALTVLPGIKAFAQSDPEPTVVIAMAPLKEQMKDIGYIADASGFGQMSFLIKMQLQQFLNGIDNEKPSGVLLYFEENKEEPTALGFLPISNMDDFLNVISQYAEVDENDDITTIVPPGGQELLMKQVGGYAYFSNREAAFEYINADPSDIVGDLPDEFNLGVKIHAQRIPKSLREQWLDTIEEGYNDSLGDLDGIPSEIQEKNFEMQMETFRSLINETEELVIGIAADEKQESIYLDFQLIAQQGSKLAKDSASQQGIDPSRFLKMLSVENAAFTANMCGELGEAERENYSSMIGATRGEIFKELNDSDMSDAELEKMEDIVDDFIAVLENTFKEGRLDGGMVVTSDDRMEFAIGMHVADAAALEKIAEDLDEAVGPNEFIEFNLNSGKMDDLRLHEMVIQLDETNSDIQEMIGEELNLLLAVGRNEVYIVGSGEDPSALLKELTAPNAAKADSSVAMQYNMYLTPILRLSANIEGEELTEKMADKLAESGKDRIRLDIKWIENGVQGRLDMQDGILEIIGVAAQNLGGAFGGAEF